MMPPRRPSRPTLRGLALTELVLSLFRAHAALLATGDDLVATFGLSSARWQVLGAIALAEAPIPVPAIARAMGLTRQGVQKQVDLLRREGLVELEDNPAHRASPLVALTRTGRGAYARADGVWRVRAEELAALFSPGEVKTAHKVLALLDTSLRAAKKEGR
jgi:DNA-binding MarR family transcriptional regulator